MTNWAYKYTANGEYSIYEFEPTIGIDDCVYADEYSVYQTKSGGKETSKLHVKQEIVFCEHSVYDNVEELIKDIEAEYTNKLKSFRRKLNE